MGFWSARHPSEAEKEMVDTWAWRTKGNGGEPVILCLGDIRGHDYFFDLEDAKHDYRNLSCAAVNCGGGAGATHGTSVGFEVGDPNYVMFVHCH